MDKQNDAMAELILAVFGLAVIASLGTPAKSPDAERAFKIQAVKSSYRDAQLALYEEYVKDLERLGIEVPLSEVRAEYDRLAAL